MEDSRHQHSSSSRNDYYDQHLILAAEEGRYPRVQKWLSKGANIHAKEQESGWTALHKASGNGHGAVTKLLLDHGADVHAKNNHGETPLYTMTCMDYGPPPHLDIVKLLISHGADPNDPDQFGSTCLYSACFFRHFEVGKFMIDHGGADVNARDKFGDTLLMMLSSEGFLDAVQFLIENGADLYAKDKEGRTELQIAIHHDSVETVNLLIPHLGPAGLNAKYENGMAPLHQVCMSGYLPIAKSLIESGGGANVHLKENEHGLSPLHNACEFGHLEVAKLLIKHGANVHVKDNRGLTPVHLASWLCHLEVVKWLIEIGVDLHAKDNNGYTPLHRACCEDDVDLEVVKLLVENGADMNARSSTTTDELTPFHIACWKGHLEIVQLLLSRGANVNLETRQGKTPLHLASEGNHPEVLVSFLVRQCPWLVVVSERSH